MVNFLVEFLSTPTIVMGIVALIGLVAMRNSPSTVITGTLKTILGFLVLSAGYHSAALAAQLVTDNAGGAAHEEQADHAGQHADGHLSADEGGDEAKSIM